MAAARSDSYVTGSVAEGAPGRSDGHGIVGHDGRAAREQSADDRERRGFADVVRVRLEAQAQHRDPGTVEGADFPLDQADQFVGLPMVDRLDGTQEGHRLAELLTAGDEGLGVLRQAAAAVAGPGAAGRT